MKGYLKLGTATSRQLAMRFGEVTGIGFAVGRRSKITVLDVDSPDERLLADAIAEYGATPIIVRSGSGNHQAWYRHAGEGRHIRPVIGKPIDILGGGYVVAPPSLGARGPYQFLEGRLDDIDRLPVMRRPAVAADTPAAQTAKDTGDRNNSLWRFAMRRALASGSKASLLDAAHLRNADFTTPMEDAEVEKIVNSAWGYTERGENRFNAPPVAFADHRTIDALAAQEPDALALLMLIERHHAKSPQFALAKAMADSMGWRLPRWKRARDVLVGFGRLRCIHQGGRGPKDPSIYELT